MSPISGRHRPRRSYRLSEALLGASFWEPSRGREQIRATRWLEFSPVEPAANRTSPRDRASHREYHGSCDSHSPHDRAFRCCPDPATRRAILSCTLAYNCNRSYRATFPKIAPAGLAAAAAVHDSLRYCGCTIRKRVVPFRLISSRTGLLPALEVALLYSSTERTGFRSTS